MRLIWTSRARRMAGIILGALISAALPAHGWAADPQAPRAGETAAEAPPDARMLADLDLLRDLELFLQLEKLQKAEAPQRVTLPRAPQEAKGRP